MLAPEPEDIGTVGTDKTGGFLIGKIQVKKGGHGRIQLCPGFNKPVIFTNRAEELPVLDQNRIGFSFAKACHKRSFVDQTS